MNRNRLAMVMVALVILVAWCMVSVARDYPTLSVDVFEAGQVKLTTLSVGGSNVTATAGQLNVAAATAGAGTVAASTLTGNIAAARLTNAVIATIQPAYASGVFRVVNTTNLAFVASGVTNIIDLDITTP